MATLVEKLVQIDSEIARDEEEAEGQQDNDDDASSTSSESTVDSSDSDREDRNARGLFTMDEMSSPGHADKSMDDNSDTPSDDDDGSENSDDASVSDEEANTSPEGKLDGLMFLLLDYVKLHMTQRDNASAMFEVLWREFVRVLLPTYQSRCVQFILFYACRYTYLSP